MHDQDGHRTQAYMLDRLLGYLEIDPENPQLLSEAALAAYESGHYLQAECLLARLERLEPLSPSQRELSGLSLFARGEFAQAREIFCGLAIATRDPIALYHLACAEAMLGNHAEAAAILTPGVLTGQPDAIPLRMSCLQRLGHLKAAIALGVDHADHASVGSEVCGLLANLYFDLGDVGLAELYARKYPEEPASLAIAGLLSIEMGDDDQAELHLAKALALTPEGGRANFGEGLRQFRCGNFMEAARYLDKGATVLGGHAGVWLSSGWAHFLLGHIEEALERFERASCIDRDFAEALGAQSMAHHLLGHTAKATHFCDMALRLDANCLAALRAAVLLAEESGDYAASAAWEQRFWRAEPGCDGGRRIDLLGRDGARRITEMAARRLH